MFLSRDITPLIHESLKHFPVVLLTGPRQTGKTELLQREFRDYTYYSLDALDERVRAQKDPRSFFVSENKKIIIDEIQEVPELLSYVKQYVDKNRSTARVILTGSHQFQLMKGVSESLAGRVAILELLPFRWHEVKSLYKSESADTLSELILRGMYPQIQTTPEINLGLWFSSYINTYLERDLRSQIAIRDMRAFEMFLQMLAVRVGQELNVHSMSKDLGVQDMTLKSWISALEAAYIIYLLPPYYENFGKRLIKTPKLYFYDTGLVCYLSKIKTAEQALEGPLAGPLFENFVVIEKVKSSLFSGQKPSLYFWRSHDGLEVDLLEEDGLTLRAYEIKLSHTITDRHGENLIRFVKYSKKNISQLILLSQSLHPSLSSQFSHKHWKEI